MHNVPHNWRQSETESEGGRGKALEQDGALYKDKS